MVIRLVNVIIRSVSLGRNNPAFHKILIQWESHVVPIYIGTP